MYSSLKKSIIEVMGLGKFSSFSEKTQFYSRNKKGVLRQLMNSQRQRSKRLGWTAPDYNTQYLQDRFLHDPTFNRLYEAWVGNGYQRLDKPSLDRIDPGLPYTKSNIQMVSYRENKAKADAGEHGRTEVIMCGLDGTEICTFPSMTVAAKHVKGSVANIAKCCKRPDLSAKGYRWKYGFKRMFERSREYVIDERPEDDLAALRRRVLSYWSSRPHLTSTQVAAVFGIDSTKRILQWRYRHRERSNSKIVVLQEE